MNRTETRPPYSTGEVADLFGVDAKTVSRWCRAGRIAYFRTPGGHIRVLAGVVDALLDGQVSP